MASDVYLRADGKLVDHQGHPLEAGILEDDGTYLGGVVLADQTVSGSAAASIALTGIPADYTKLTLDVFARSTGAAVISGVSVAFNGDTTTANYAMQYLRGLAGVASAGEDIGATAGARAVGVVPGASVAYADAFGVMGITIPNYASATQAKALLSQSSSPSGASGQFHLEQRSVLWKNTAAINQITLATFTGMFAVGSRVILRGHKGAA